MHEKPEASFIAAVEPLRGALRVHCYRMLGSAHDGEDVVQETMLRAWRSRDSLKDPGMLRSWLYRIATNACLDELKRRPRRALASDVYPPEADPRGPVAPPIDEPVWLEPMPDTWLVSTEQADPAARYTLKESVALAFVAALQFLTPLQRATLLLRDVVGLSAEETAEAVAVSISAANSALFRAREAVEEKVGGRDPSTIASSAAGSEELLARYIRAFEARDADGFLALVHEDVRTTMPPSPTWIEGRAANVAFFRQMFAGQPGARRITRTAANGQPALAYYRSDGDGQPYLLRAIQVLAIRDGKVATIDHFTAKEVLAAFELPAQIA
ncbi:MAG TPA: RNA polymerase subunit sigma-70 [Polyangiaceae bacterium]